jgi:carbonic anhydrase
MRVRKIGPSPTRRLGPHQQAGPESIGSRPAGQSRIGRDGTRDLRGEARLRSMGEKAVCDTCATLAFLMMNRLLDGVRRFRHEIYPSRRDLYEEVARTPQRPHTLFVTCADSRIDPELITQSGPGEIFVTRNIGNLVPGYGEMLGGVSAVIEYAVAALDVKHVVICGHTDCGAMKALLDPQQTEKLPTVKAWLRNAEAARSVVAARNNTADEEHVLNALIEENVLLQLMHLRTHPSVAGRLAERTLTVHGWVYDIGNGDIRIHDAGSERFVPIDEFEITLPERYAAGSV